VARGESEVRAVPLKRTTTLNFARKGKVIVGKRTRKGRILDCKESSFYRGKKAQTSIHYAKACGRGTNRMAEDSSRVAQT